MRFNPRAPLPGRASGPAIQFGDRKRCFNPRAPLPGRASSRYCGAASAIDLVSILAPRCRGAHRLTSLCMRATVMFQSSRPVAGARIARLSGLTHWSRTSFNPRAPLPGRASSAKRIFCIIGGLFQSSRPVAGARISRALAGVSLHKGFNPRAPLPGRASRLPSGLGLLQGLFQSSRPVAGARISKPSRGICTAARFNPRAPLPGRASPLAQFQKLE